MIYKTKMRGTFEGSTRVLKQAFKDGKKINFLEPQSFKNLAVNNFA